MIGTMPHELSIDSKIGIYQCQNTKDFYWKINQAEAILLSQNYNLAQFTLVDLSVTPVDQRSWVNYVYPRIRGSEFGNIVGRSGILIRKGLRLYIRANTVQGRGYNAMIEDIQFEDMCRFSQYYFEWDLVVIRDGQEHVVFSSPNPLPRLCIVEDDAEVERGELHPSHWKKVMKGPARPL
jgi:hypothetical protein